jgi:hypothetical protein
MEDSKPPRTRKGGWVNPKTLPKNEDGRPQCRWCSGSVMPPRRTFCSDACVHEHSKTLRKLHVRQKSIALTIKQKSITNYSKRMEFLKHENYGLEDTEEVFGMLII